MHTHALYHILSLYIIYLSYIHHITLYTLYIYNVYSIYMHISYTSYICIYILHIYVYINIILYSNTPRMLPSIHLIPPESPPATSSVYSSVYSYTHRIYIQNIYHIHTPRLIIYHSICIYFYTYSNTIFRWS